MIILVYLCVCTLQQTGSCEEKGAFLLAWDQLHFVCYSGVFNNVFHDVFMVVEFWNEKCFYITMYRISKLFQYFQTRPQLDRGSRMTFPGSLSEVGGRMCGRRENVW